MPSAASVTSRAASVTPASGSTGHGASTPEAGRSSVVVAAAAVPRVPAARPASDQVVETARPVAPHGLVVAEAWARLLSAMVVVIAAAVAVMMPVVGVVASVAAVVPLRLVGARTGRERVLSLGRMLVGLPYAVACGAVVTLGLAGLSIFKAEVDPLAACGLGAGAGVAALWAAPGIRGPRLGMQRLLAPVAPRGIALAGVVLGLLAFVAMVGAISLTPSFAPMYGLQSSLESSIARLQNTLG
jgi:hypothetical protein